MELALNTVEDIEVINLRIFGKASGKLFAVENFAGVPWEIKRVFIITTENYENRGNHAHKNCNQAFIVLSGQISLKCFDGSHKALYTLLPMEKILCIPPHIWVNLEMGPASILMVLSEKLFDEEDYIRNKQDFFNFRKIE
jgi:hypothetical protein